MKKQDNGFTLIECLVALVIIAIILTSATKAMVLAIDDVKDSYVREAASWVAANQYNQYYINQVFPNPGSTQQDVSMAGMDFLLTSTISNTQNPFFRRIDISVSEKSHPTYALFKTVSFISQY